MAEYSYQGYTSQWKRALYLPLDEPFILWAYIPADMTGAVCGVGGEAVFDLSMELTAPGVNITDEYPDDLPVLYFSTDSIPVRARLTVEAADMLYGAQAESVYVFYAMKAIEPEEELTVTAEPDSTQ